MPSAHLGKVAELSQTCPWLQSSTRMHAGSQEPLTGGAETAALVSFKGLERGFFRRNSIREHFRDIGQSRV